jgi:hypothetical protein
MTSLSPTFTKRRQVVNCRTITLTSCYLPSCGHKVTYAVHQSRGFFVDCLPAPAGCLPGGKANNPPSIGKVNCTPQDRSYFWYSGIMNGARRGFLSLSALVAGSNGLVKVTRLTDRGSTATLGRHRMDRKVRLRP